MTFAAVLCPHVSVSQTAHTSLFPEMKDALKQLKTTLGQSCSITSNGIECWWCTVCAGILQKQGEISHDSEDG